MTNRLDFYDVLACVVPGALMVYIVPALFPSLSTTLSTPDLPDAFVVVVDAAAAIFVGHLIQAVGSLIEPALNWTWGGRPSERALDKGLGERYLPEEAASRIRALLEAESGSRCSRSLFLFAMERAGQEGRAERFNALYAYHRSLLTLTVVVVLLFILSAVSGAAAQWSLTTEVIFVLLGLLALLLVWHRTKQRAYYYVREVLHEAEKALKRMDCRS